VTGGLSEEAKEKLKQIRGQPSTVDVNGVEFEIHPFDTDEFLEQVIGDKERGASKTEITIGLVSKVLQKDDDMYSREFVRQAPPGLLTAVMNEIEQVNGMEGFLSEASEIQ